MSDKAGDGAAQGRAGLALEWRLILYVAAADALLLAAAAFGGRPWRIAWIPEFLLAAAALVLAAVWWAYRSLRPEPRLAGTARAALLLVIYFNVIATLSYLSVGMSGLPLFDAHLAALDRALGLDWMAYYRWLTASPQLALAVRVIYASLGPQMPVLYLLLNLAGHEDRARELFLASACSSFAVVAFGALLPAAGAFVYYGVPEARTTLYVQEYLAVRQGLRVFDLRILQGLVQFPSFHAVLAVMCAHAVRGMRALFPLSLLLNGLIVAVTPIGGGHHFVDVLAGLLLAALVLWVTGFRESSAGVP
jgi:PAP2 superfamily protein